jgi:hypothetical protein
MTLPLTPETLAAAYDYLKSTPPFSSWNLPEAEDVEFKVSNRKGEFGRYQWDGKKHTIAMSAKSIGQTETLLRYLSHEIVHLHLEATGMESTPGTGAGFWIASRHLEVGAIR